MNKRHIVWLYDKAHKKQPFIGLSLKTLSEHNCQVSMIDASIIEKNKIKIPDYYKYYPLLHKQAIACRIMLKIHKSRKFAYATPQMIWIIKKLNPDIIICTGPACLLIGWIYKKFKKCRLVYYPFELYGEQNASFSKYMLAIEKKILGFGIDALITQNEHRAKVYVEERNASIRPIIVHNYKTRNCIERNNYLRKILQVEYEIPIIIYQGYLLEGRNIENLLKAFYQLNKNAIMVFISKKNRYYEESLKPIIKKCKIEDRIYFLPWVQSDEVASFITGANVGVVIYDNQKKNNQFCEPGKIGDYISAEVPVIAPSFPTIKPMFDKFRIGVLFDPSDPKNIAEAIRKVIEEKSEFWQKNLKIAQKNIIWETQEGNLLTAVIGK